MIIFIKRHQRMDKSETFVIFYEAIVSFAHLLTFVAKAVAGLWAN